MQQYTSTIVTGGALAIKENFFFALALEKTSKLWILKKDTDLFEA